MLAKTATKNDPPPTPEAGDTEATCTPQTVNNGALLMATAHSTGIIEKYIEHKSIPQVECSILILVFQVALQWSVAFQMQSAFRSIYKQMT